MLILLEENYFYSNNFIEKKNIFSLITLYVSTRIDYI
jgi:hypothetical protein